MQSEQSALISVIIPAYNYAAFLPEAIGSLTSQTFSNWECIVVDDGSTDNTREVMEQLRKNDSRIHYHVQENAGPTVARNLGLEKAKGEFLQFLDADDVIEEKKFERQLELFQKHPDVDVVYGNVKYFRSGKRSEQFDNISLEGSGPWMKKLSGRGEEMIKAFLRENLMVIQAPLFRRRLIDKCGKMDERLFYNEDWELWTRFAIGGAKFLFDESPGTNSLVRVHDSYSKDNTKMYIHGLLASLKMNEMLDGREYKKILIPKIAYHKRILDERIIERLAKSREEGLALAAVVTHVTGDKRYEMYSRNMLRYPVWFWYLYSKFLAVIHKIKNSILYA